MVESLKRDIEHLKKLKEFKEYKKQHISSYLCAAFAIIESSKKTRWQLDYYCPENDMMTTFCFDPSFHQKESKTIHRDKKKVREINIENIDIGLEKSLEIISEFKNKRYPNEKINKIIVILQNIDKKETWNITYLTSNFNLLNVNVDAQKGSIITERFDSILNFKAQ